MNQPFREAISKYFSLEDFRTLCFDLQIDYDSLRGEGKDAKVRELIITCEQKALTLALLAALIKARPQVDWNQLASSAMPSPSANDSTTNAFDKPETLLGTSIGVYNLLAFIGGGGSGLVFRATHATLGKEVALKLFYPLGAEYGSFYERFRQGFRAIGALDHPNIIKIIDFDETQINGRRTFFLVMEYIAGVDLESWSRGLANDATALQQRGQMAVKIARALQAAHNTTYTDLVGFEVRGVLHGDLKPANILVTGQDEPKLLDFLLVDLQRLLDPEVIPSHILRLFEMERGPVPITGAMGTPGFMAPEQQEKGIVTTKTDIYSLGITFMHLFAPNENTRISDLVQSLPADVRTLLLERMIGSPETRPTIDEVIQILSAHFANMPVAPSSPADEPPKGVLGKLKEWLG